MKKGTHHTDESRAKTSESMRKWRASPEGRQASERHGQKMTVLNRLLALLEAAPEEIAKAPSQE